MEILRERFSNFYSILHNPKRAALGVPIMILYALIESSG
jgi:hypothetical protein